MKKIVIVGVFLLFGCQGNSSFLDPVIENVRHIKATQPPGKVDGIWKKKMLWKPRWIKEWKSSNVLKPIWKKFWGPVIIREWVPIPKPPPNWDLHSNLLSTKPANSFSDLDQPPAPNFSYLPSSTAPPKIYLKESSKLPFLGYTASRNAFNLANHQSLPIINASSSQAESYKGHSSYGTYIDSTAFDLNPPVEQFTPQQDYNNYGSIGNINHASSGPSLRPSGHPRDHHGYHNHHHHHHHHRHHHIPDNHHTHINDPARFPPDWNSWNSMLSSSFPLSLTQQASSAVSVISEVQSTTLKTDVEVSSQVPDVQSGNANFIQQAALIGEYHYTESNPNELSHSVRPSGTQQLQRQPGTISSIYSQPVPIPHLKLSPVNHHQNGQRIKVPITQSYPSPTRQSQSPDPRYNHSRFPEQVPPPPRNKPMPQLQQPKVSSSMPSNMVLPTRNVTPQQRHPIRTFPKQQKPIFDKIKNPENFEVYKLPDFKALPSSIEAFRFIEAAVSSNHNFTTGNPVKNQTNKSNNISISSSEEVPSYISKLAESVVLQHIRKTNESISSTTERTVTSSENKVTVVLPTTISSINKTLKAYLAEENKSDKSENVFVVTPIPQTSDQS